MILQSNLRWHLVAIGCHSSFAFADAPSLDSFFEVALLAWVFAFVVSLLLLRGLERFYYKGRELSMLKAFLISGISSVAGTFVAALLGRTLIKLAGIKASSVLWFLPFPFVYLVFVGSSLRLSHRKS